MRRANELGRFDSKIPATPAQQLQANQQLREKIDVGMFPYQRVASGNYRPSDRLSTAVADVVWTPDQRAGAASRKGLLPPDQVQRPTGTLVDNASGLVVSILINHKDKDIAAVFGGTTAGRVAGSPLRLALGNREMALPQWTANAKTGLGLSTRSHEQAQQVVGTLRDLQQTPRFRSLANYTISTMGHSKGGGEAASAAIANYSFAAPITVTGLSSAPLHTSQLRSFAAKGIDVAEAERHIDIYSVKLDPVPNLGHLLKPAGATVVGAEHVYSAPVWADPVTRHVKSDRFIGAALKKQDEALMKAP